MPEITQDEIMQLGATAWLARERAHIVKADGTKVGAALREAGGSVSFGCNTEHRYRCHDVHAEVCAVVSMVACGGRRIVAIVVAAQREKFTPCGGCMDWIMQFGGPECVVGFQAERGGPVELHTAGELMPFYPS